MSNKKVDTARLSIISNSCLIVMKATVGIFSGSVSIISETIHSTIDLLASIISFFSVKISDRKPDEEHPYGHGKYENISGVIEALLIFIAAVWIIFEAVKKIISHTEIDRVGWGFIVMLASAIINFFISRKLYKVAKQFDSIALEADALHLKVDIYTSIGVAIGLLLIKITGYYLLDPIVAILVAVMILRESFVLLKNAYAPLLDTKLPDEEIEIITKAIEKNKSENISFHQLRTRKAGHLKYVDLHLEVPHDYSVKQSHDICDSIEKEIENKIKNIEVHIHVEPVNKAN